MSLQEFAGSRESEISRDAQHAGFRVGTGLHLTPGELPSHPFLLKLSPPALPPLGLTALLSQLLPSRPSPHPPALHHPHPAQSAHSPGCSLVPLLTSPSPLEGRYLVDQLFTSDPCWLPDPVALPSSWVQSPSSESFPRVLPGPFLPDLKLRFYWWIKRLTMEKLDSFWKPCYYHM